MQKWEDANSWKLLVVLLSGTLALIFLGFSLPDMVATLASYLPKP